MALCQLSYQKCYLKKWCRYYSINPSQKRFDVEGEGGNLASLNVAQVKNFI
jgi:hypothetical protein